MRFVLGAQSMAVMSLSCYSARWVGVSASPIKRADESGGKEPRRGCQSARSQTRSECRSWPRCCSRRRRPLRDRSCYMSVASFDDMTEFVQARTRTVRREGVGREGSVGEMEAGGRGVSSRRPLNSKRRGRAHSHFGGCHGEGGMCEDSSSRLCKTREREGMEVGRKERGYPGESDGGRHHLRVTARRRHRPLGDGGLDLGKPAVISQRAVFRMKEKGTAVLIG